MPELLWDIVREVLTTVLFTFNPREYLVQKLMTRNVTN